MPLTDLAVLQAQPQEKSYTLADSHHLSLFVATHGTKSWHFRFSWQCKQYRISLGTYPQISLHEARYRRDDACRLLSQGIDPRVDRQTTSSVLFCLFAEQWFERKTKKLTAKNSSKPYSTQICQIRRYLDKDILPILGYTRIKYVTVDQLIAVQQKIEARRAFAVAEKVRTWLTEIFTSAITLGELQTNRAQCLEEMAVFCRRRKKRNLKSGMQNVHV